MICPALNPVNKQYDNRMIVKLLFGNVFYNIFIYGNIIIIFLIVIMLIDVVLNSKFDYYCVMISHK